MKEISITMIYISEGFINSEVHNWLKLTKAPEAVVKKKSNIFILPFLFLF